MWIGPVQRASAQFENLKTVALDHALDPKLCSLAHWARSTHIQQNGAWNKIEGVIIEMLVSVPQTH